MHIKSLILYSNDIESQIDFFANVLDLKVEQNNDGISVNIGASRLSFVASNDTIKYHYCLLVPSNQFKSSVEWMANRVDLIEVSPQNYVQNFEDWNADSIYFYDGNGNLLEFIARYDLDNNVEGAFDENMILNINEIGMTSSDTKTLNEIIEAKTGSEFYKGNLTRFGANGDDHGIFLLVNYAEKKTWFPTQIPTLPAPFEAIVECRNKTSIIKYSQEMLTIN